MWIKSWFDLPIMDNYHVEIIVWVLWAYHYLNKAVKSIFFEKSDENLKTVLSWKKEVGKACEILSTSDVMGVAGMNLQQLWSSAEYQAI